MLLGAAQRQHAAVVMFQIFFGLHPVHVADSHMLSYSSLALYAWRRDFTRLLNNCAMPPFIKQGSRISGVFASVFGLHPQYVTKVTRGMGPIGELYFSLAARHIHIRTFRGQP